MKLEFQIPHPVQATGIAILLAGATLLSSPYTQAGTQDSSSCPNLSGSYLFISPADHCRFEGFDPHGQARWNDALESAVQLKVDRHTLIFPAHNSEFRIVQHQCSRIDLWSASYTGEQLLHSAQLTDKGYQWKKGSLKFKRRKGLWGPTVRFEYSLNAAGNLIYRTRAPDPRGIISEITVTCEFPRVE